MNIKLISIVFFRLTELLWFYLLHGEGQEVGIAEKKNWIR